MYHDWYSTKRWNWRAEWNNYSAFSWLRYDHTAEGSNLESALISGLFKSNYHEQWYTFKIKKCKDASCCSLSTVPGDIKWLPDPQLKEDGEHFISFSNTIKLESTDKTDCPTIKKIASKLSKKSKGKICSNKAKQFKQASSGA